MKVLRGDYRTWGRLAGPTHLTIGVFDGVHRGHQSILEALRARAGSEAVGVLTFSKHPATVLRPDDAPAMLTGLTQRLELLAHYGTDVAAVLEFDQVRPMEPETFVADIVSGVMAATHVTVGKGFRFGYEMSGDEHTLVALGERHGFSVEVVDIMGGAAPVSSTVIRATLEQGDVESVAAMLGRPYQLRGAVVVGDHRGRQLGFPTANLEMAHGRSLPGHGVYSARARGADGELRPAVVNVGVRPTFGGMRPVVEVHVLDVDLDLYGQELRVDFVSRIRPERRFDGIDELVEQIGRDIETARGDLARGSV